MNFNETKLELEYTEEERICSLGGEIAGKVCFTKASRPNRIKNNLISRIKNGSFTLSCCIIQVICFCLESEKILALFCYAPDKKDQLWRVLTYAFLHSNLYHLVPNLLFLLLVGMILEYDQGFWRTFIVYTTGIISGAFGCNFFGDKQKVIGTSAASYSLLVAHIVHIKLNWKNVRFKDYRIVIISCLLFSDVISYFLSSVFFQSTVVSWSSHFSASINGLLISSIFFQSRKPCYSYRYFTLCIYVILMTFLLTIYVPKLTHLVCHYSSYSYLDRPKLEILENTQHSSVDCSYHNVP